MVRRAGLRKQEMSEGEGMSIEEREKDLDQYIAGVRRDAIQTAKESLSQPLIIFDTETTGLHGDAEVIEIAAVDLTGNVLIDTLVKPSVPVPEDATAIHGIRDEDLATAPDITEVLPDLEAVFADKVLACYNLDFDLRLLNQSLYARGHEQRDWVAFPFKPENRWDRGLCIMNLFAEFYGEYSDYHGSFTWQRLGNAAIYCDVTVDAAAHRALADAQMALGVLKYMASGGR